MSAPLLKWVLPGLLIVAAGASVSIAMGGAPVAPDLADRRGSSQALHVAQSTTQESRSSGSIVTLEPRVSPYWFMAVLSDGTVTLDGNVPNAAVRDRFAAAGADISGLEIARGEPERFEPAVDFGIEILTHLSEGRFTLRENVITLKGRARTGMDLAAVEALVGQGAPQGAVLAMAEIDPPVADPYLWSATKNGDAIAIDGNTPDKATKTSLTAAAGRGASDASTIADGAPDGFAASATGGLGLLAMLDNGAVTYNGSGWSLSGTTTSPQQALEIEQAFAAAGLRDAGWTYDVRLPTAVPAEAPPNVAAYTWSAEKLPAGTMALSGFVPNAGLQRFLAAHAGGQAVDTSALGSGAPDDFALAAVAGLDAVQLLDEGRVAFANGRWSLTGRTGNHELPVALLAQLAQAVDTEGWDIDIKAPPPPLPVADPYTWSAAKAADGSFTLAGNLPNEGFKAFVAAHAGTVSADTTAIAEGEPAGFSANVLAALAALDHLVEGTVGYDGANWFVSGTPQTAGDADAAVAALSTAMTAPGSWLQTIATPLTVPGPAEPETAAADQPLPEPEPLEVPEAVAETPDATATTTAAEPEPSIVAAVEPSPDATQSSIVAMPAVTPAFGATRADNGPVVLSGVVPTDPARRWFGVIAGNAPTDGLTIAANLPPTFIPNADAGLRALNTLSAGTLAYDGNGWSLRGTADTPAARDTALAAVSSLPDSGAWTTDIALTPPVALCRREVVAFEADHRILFQSGRAQMTDASEDSLTELAGFLNDCPAVTVEVEGHTDADGPEDDNLALSVSRAEAVVDSLIAKGVAPERLYAVGYGESMPIASNDTAAGKQANRRIVFTLVE